MFEEVEYKEMPSEEKGNDRSQRREKSWDDWDLEVLIAQFVIADMAKRERSTER